MKKFIVLLLVVLVAVTLAGCKAKTVETYEVVHAKEKLKFFGCPMIGSTYIYANGYESPGGVAYFPIFEIYAEEGFGYWNGQLTVGKYWYTDKNSDPQEPAPVVHGPYDGSSIIIVKDDGCSLAFDQSDFQLLEVHTEELK